MLIVNYSYSSIHKHTITAARYMTYKDEHFIVKQLLRVQSVSNQRTHEISLKETKILTTTTTTIITRKLYEQLANTVRVSSVRLNQWTHEKYRLNTIEMNITKRLRGSTEDNEKYDMNELNKWTSGTIDAGITRANGWT